MSAEPTSPKRSIGDLLRLFGNARSDLIRSKLDLLALEGQLAAWGIAKLAGAVLGMVFLLLCAWALLCVTLGWWLVSSFSWPLTAVFLSIAVVQCIGVLLLCLFAYRTLTDLSFAASRRQILGTTDGSTTDT